MEFKGYEVQDSGITLRFVCFSPGPSLPTDYAVSVTDAELASATTSPLLRALVIGKLQRKILAATVAAKLDPFIGQVVVI